MQTGQHSIVPENSLPQLGQMRLGSVLMALTALQPHSEAKATPYSHRAVRKRPAQSLVNCCPVAKAIGCCFILARQITFRNKIPTLGVLRRPGLYAFQILRPALLPPLLSADQARRTFNQAANECSENEAKQLLQKPPKQVLRRS